MKLDAKDVGGDVEMDMSPMIDMVFLLLIFFIVASQIIDEKPKVRIPAAAAATVPEKNDDRLMISITKDDEFYFRMQEVPFEELTLRIQQEFEANNNLRILIRADGDVKFETNEKVMMACAEIGAVDIIFSATEE